jgi:hypothetical protein
LALYKAKVLTRNFRYEEAEKILQEVRFFWKFCYIWEIGTVWIELLNYIYWHKYLWDSFRKFIETSYDIVNKLFSDFRKLFRIACEKSL